MCRAMMNLCRLDEVRSDVIGFEACNRDQRAQRRRLLHQMDLAERYDCRPGREEAFERTWNRIEQMREHLESSEMAWKPWWISRALYGAWQWLAGAGWRLRDLWFRLGVRVEGLKERLLAARWAIEARLWRLKDREG